MFPVLIYCYIGIILEYNPITRNTLAMQYNIDDDRKILNFNLSSHDCIDAPIKINNKHTKA